MLNKIKIRKNLIIKALLSFVLLFFVFLPAFSYEPYDINQRVETTAEDIPHFTSPVCLLVGLNSSELAYQEVSALSGFELFTVPYRTDIKILTQQINPTQIIIKHPSGFVGLYLPDGQLIRGVHTASPSQVALQADVLPQSIIQPVEANPMFDNIYYPGSLTGGIPHGGIGYTVPPKGRGLARHFLKLATLLGLVPYQYPGYFKQFQAIAPKKELFPYFVGSQIPLGIGAVASYADSKLDEAEYADARVQPRDYKFQPVIEGY